MTKKKREPAVAFTRKVKDFILEQMSNGLDIAEICNKYPDKVPNRATIYRKGISDPEFSDELNQAYTVLLMHRLDELHSISSKTAAELYPEVEDWRQAEAALKRRVDSAKFVLGKMAPVLSKRFDRTSRVEVSGKIEGSAPQIAVINYYKSDIRDSVPHHATDVASLQQDSNLIDQDPK